LLPGLLIQQGKRKTLKCFARTISVGGVKKVSTESHTMKGRKPECASKNMTRNQNTDKRGIKGGKLEEAGGGKGQKQNGKVGQAVALICPKLIFQGTGRKGGRRTEPRERFLGRKISATWTDTPWVGQKHAKNAGTKKDGTKPPEGEKKR